MDVSEHIDALAGRGIEVVLQGNRLRTWPPRSYTHGLSEAERDFQHAHAPEIKDWIRTHGHRETTVVWVDPSVAMPTPAPPRSAPPTCRYCGDRPCVGPDSPWYRVLHWNAPSEIARRDSEATRLMMAQIGKPRDY